MTRRGYRKKQGNLPPKRALDIDEEINLRMEKTIKKPKKNTFYANVKKVAKRFYAKFEAMLHRDREPEAQEGEIFIERRKQRPFVLAVFFTTLKILFVCVLVFGCACVGLVLGVAKAYIDTTPEPVSYTHLDVYKRQP